MDTVYNYFMAYMVFLGLINQTINPCY